MYAVTIRQYGDESNLKLEHEFNLPDPKPNQVLVKVNASSVNPIDLMTVSYTHLTLPTILRV